jgi:signal transduction histidine kinase
MARALHRPQGGRIIEGARRPGAQDGMRELPRAAIAYLLAVAALGTAVLAHAALGLELSAGRLPEVLLFVVLSTAADLNRLELKYSAGYSVATAINLASVIILGTDTAVWVSAISSAAGETWQRRPWYKVAFNTFNVAISVAAGGAVYDALRRSPVGTVAPADLPALLAYTIVNFLVNHALVCLVISLSTRARPWTVFTTNYRSILIPALALFPIGVLFAIAYTSFGRLLGVFLLFVPFGAVFVALSRARQLQLQTEELAKRDAEAAALRELDRLKNEFLRTISHELRTPLTLVHGYAELLHSRAQTLDDTGKRMVSRIYSGSAQLARLVEDLLDFSRIERGEMAVETEDFDLVPVMREQLAAFQGSVSPGRLVLHVPESLPVHADQARMAQVVSNLVENAIKYAPQGQITVRARRIPGGGRGAGSQAGWPGGGLGAGPQASALGGARVEVQDEGPGIPPEEQPRVWEKFYRGSQVAGRNATPGSGIGLAVVRALVEAQGGEVGLRSAPGQGTTFWLEVPLAEAPLGELEPDEGAQPTAQLTEQPTPEPAPEIGLRRLTS